MSTRAPQPCSHPGCPALCQGGLCPKHAKQRQQQIDVARGNAAKRGYGHRWRKARAAFLAAHPLCAECERHGVVSAATDVDHIRPHRGDASVFWDQSNWQALCHTCHSRKTAVDDGRYGRAVSRRPRTIARHPGGGQESMALPA